MTPDDIDESRALCWHNVEEDGIIVAAFLGVCLAVVAIFLFSYYVPLYVGSLVHDNIRPCSSACDSDELWDYGAISIVIGIALAGCGYFIMEQSVALYSWALGRYYPPPSKCPDDEAEKAAEIVGDLTKKRETSEGHKLGE